MLQGVILVDTWTWFYFVLIILLLLLQKTIYGANVIVFEGIMSFTNKELLRVSVDFFYGHAILVEI